MSLFSAHSWEGEGNSSTKKLLLFYLLRRKLDLTYNAGLHHLSVFLSFFQDILFNHWFYIEMQNLRYISIFFIWIISSWCKSILYTKRWYDVIFFWYIFLYIIKRINILIVIDRSINITYFQFWEYFKSLCAILFSINCTIYECKCT